MHITPIRCRHQDIAGKRWTVEYIPAMHMTVEYVIYPKTRLIQISSAASALAAERAYDAAHEHERRRCPVLVAQ